MSLEEELSAAIDKDLPNQVGSRLKARLEEAELNEALLKETEASNDRLTKEVEQLRRDDRDDRNVREREEAVVGKEHELDLREYKLTVREEYAEKGKADMHMMMGTIFKCPDARTLAFNLYGNANGVTNAQGYQESPSLSLSGDITEKDA